MTVPELPLICNKPRFLNFRSWRPHWVITVAVLCDEGGLEEAAPKKWSTSEHLSVQHHRKAISSYATLTSIGLWLVAAVEALRAPPSRAVGLLPGTPNDSLRAEGTFPTCCYSHPSGTAAVETWQEGPTSLLLRASALLSTSPRIWGSSSSTILCVFS